MRLVTISMKLTFPLAYKMSFIYRNRNVETNEIKKRIAVECICFLAQYELVRQKKKRPFDTKIFISKGQFYFPQITETCLVSDFSNSDEAMWKAFNEIKWYEWTGRITPVLDKYIELPLESLVEKTKHVMQDVCNNSNAFSSGFSVNDNLTETSLKGSITRLSLAENKNIKFQKIFLLVLIYLTSITIFPLFLVMISLNFNANMIMNSTKNRKLFIAISCALLILITIIIFYVKYLFSLVTKKNLFEQEYKIVSRSLFKNN